MKMEAQIKLINVDDIIPNRFQPRLKFDEEGLNELASSIREHGIIQPLVLRRIQDKYEIIAGERRFKAASIVGLQVVPAIIADLNDNESAEIAIIENTQRRNLSAIEEAKSYKKLLDRKYVTQDQLAQRLGTSQSNVANKIRLLSLDEQVQDALLKEKISERHARSLLKISDNKVQIDFLNKIINEKWPVRKLDEEIDAYLTKDTRYKTMDNNISNIINNAQDLQFTGKVQYQRSEEINKGKDSLFFNNLENESANMDPVSNFGFNPFQTTINNNRDFEIFDIDEEEDNDDETPVKYVKEEYYTLEDVVNGINKIIENAKSNDVLIESEKFNFDNYDQFIIRINKQNKN